MELEELRGLVRIGYIAIHGDDENPEDEVLRKKVIVINDEPPQTPYFQIHITVVETEPRYFHERETGGLNASTSRSN